MSMTQTKNKINFLDFIVFLTVLLSLIGFVFANNGKAQINKVIQGKEIVAIEIYLSDVVSDKKDIFMTGDETSLTVRNRPTAKLKIIQVKTEPKQVVIPFPGPIYKVVDDPTRANTKNYTVILSDEALKTSDGYILSGNKIKIGNQIELEGFNYRLSGKVTDIYPIKNVTSLKNKR